MNTETLKNIGLDDEQIKQVMVEYGKELNPLKQENAELTAERDSLTAQVADVNAKLGEAQSAAEKDSDLAKQLQSLQEEFDASKTEAQTQLANTKKGYEVDMALAKAGALNNKAAKALLDLDKVAFGEDNQLTGLSEQLEAVMTDNPFLFQAAEAKEPGTPKIIPAGNPDPEPTPEADPFEAILASYEK